MRHFISHIMFVFRVAFSPRVFNLRFPAHLDEIVLRHGDDAVYIEPWSDRNDKPTILEVSR
jgi:hypothetical protein